MSEILKVAIPALSALFGVIVGLALGFYQWRVERREVKISEYLRKRRESYQIFFDKLEDAHLELRSSNIEKEDFMLFVIDVNQHLLKNAVYMDQEDRDLANEYLNNLFDLKEKFMRSNNDRKKQEYRATVVCSPSNPNSLEGKVKSLREQIVEKVRNVIKT